MPFDRIEMLRRTEHTRGGRRLYVLDRDLIFRTGLDGERDGIRVTIPAGLMTDLQSVPPWLECLFPRFFRWLFPPGGPWISPVILHDYLYSLEGCTRFLADALFRVALGEADMPLRRRIPIFYAVRLFGGSHRSVEENSRKGAKAERKVK